MGHLREFSEGAEAGIVDQNVDGNTFGLQLIEENFRGEGSGQIEGHSLDCDSLCSQFGRELCKFISVAGCEYQIVMIAGEELGEFVSDAAGGAGDQDCGHDAILMAFV